MTTHLLTLNAMLEKTGLHVINADGRTKLKFDGAEVDSVVSHRVNSFGLYVDGKRISVDGTAIAQSSGKGSLTAEGDELHFGNVDMITDGECVNITIEDYNTLLQGGLVDGYKRYSPLTIYNIVADVASSPKVTYSVADGVVEFSTGESATYGKDALYNNFTDELQENTIDLAETLANTDCPFVNVRWFDPIVPVGGKIALNYYVDSQSMPSLKDGEIGTTFTVIVKTAGGATAKKTTYAGEFSIETPVFGSAGETWFSVECINSNGTGSAVQYFDILVRDAVTPNYYTMTENDLAEYGIVADDDDIQTALANKAALTAFFAAVKQQGYNGVVMLKRTYWVDYHAVDGFGTQTYYRCHVEGYTEDQDGDKLTNGYITSVEPCTEQEVINAGVQTKKFVSVPEVGDEYNDFDGDYYIVYNTSASGDEIQFPDEFTVDLNGGTIAATACDDVSGGVVVKFDGNFDTHIINGNIKGNYEIYDFPAGSRKLGANAPAEWLAATSVNSSRYCSLEGLDVSGSMGYEAAITQNNTVVAEPVLTNSQRVDLQTGEIVSANGFVTTQKISLTNATAMGAMPNRYIAFGRSGYGGYVNMGVQRECFVSFYDTTDAYIGSIKTRLYYLVSVPANATKATYTLYGKVYDENNPNNIDWKVSHKNGVLRLFCPHASRAIKYKGCHWHDTRTTAISYMLAKNVLIDDCTYYNIASERGEYGVTRVFGGLEDSWNWCNGVRINNITCDVGQGSNYFFVNFAFNFEFCNNKGLRLGINGGLESGFVENNELIVSRGYPYAALTLAINSRCYHPQVIYRNNRIDSLAVSFADGAEPTVVMSDTVIKNFCGYPYLRLIDSVNGDIIVDRQEVS